MADFNTEFDYTPALNYAGNVISSCSISKDDMETQIAAYQGVSGHSTIVNAAIAELESRKNNLESTISSFESLVQEIGNVSSLPSGEKDTFYSFYNDHLSTLEPKHVYMARLLYNTGNLLPEITTITSDGGLTPTQVSDLAKHLCQMYPIDERAKAVEMMDLIPH